MPSTRTKRRKVLVQTDTGKPKRQGSSKLRGRDRERMQLVPVQHVQGGDDSKRFQLLLSFVKHMCRMTVSSDVIYLSLRAAQEEVDAPEEDVKALVMAAYGEKELRGQWPKGF